MGYYNYPLGAPFTTIQWLYYIKEANMQITCWYLAHQPFKFKEVQRPWAQMVVDDYLSCHVGNQLKAEQLLSLSQTAGVIWWQKHIWNQLWTKRMLVKPAGNVMILILMKVFFCLCAFKDFCDQQKREVQLDCLDGACKAYSHPHTCQRA